ncbi:hypothetical protein [Carboxylicivirga sp. N1Y90]|uniref:hypothetical protein n=1 Tax=Carboxylicivirga fragile TaxID=3417571 RepID=UPI003D333E36|nr:hypothetical protein [Marinilabiliaceae bacterium N1Y90]
MKKWRSDAKSINILMLATELTYNLTLEIYSKTGELIASNNIHEVEQGLCPSGTVSTKKIKKKVIDIKYPVVMTTLFADAKIEKALQ